MTANHLAMQWVDGMTLEQLIADEGPMEIERAVGVIEAVAAALDHAHDQGVVHGDVRPGNVMVDAAGAAHLVDFGLNVGTDRRADVSGLSALAFRCLTGRRFEFDGPAAHELRPAVPPAASETLRRGLADRPADRPATAGAFAAELRAATGDGDPGATIALSALPEDVRVPASRRTRRVLAAVVAAVLAALGGMSLAGITGGGSPSAEPPPATAETTAAEPAPDG